MIHDALGISFASLYIGIGLSEIHKPCIILYIESEKCEIHFAVFTKEHEIKFSSLLNMTEKDLENIGISQVS